MTIPTPNVLLDLATDYVLHHAPRVKDADFRVGDRANLRAGLTFHALQGTLRLEWNDQLQLVGLGIVWQDFRERILALHEAGRNAWQWQPTQAAGDCLYLALVMTTQPGVLQRLAAHFFRQFPDLPALAYRRGRLVETPHLLARLAGLPPQLN